jgi:hypothetical protein
MARGWLIAGLRHPAKVRVISAVLAARSARAVLLTAAGDGRALLLWVATRVGTAAVAGSEPFKVNRRDGDASRFFFSTA